MGGKLPLFICRFTGLDAWGGITEEKNLRKGQRKTKNLKNFLWVYGVKFGGLLRKRKVGRYQKKQGEVVRRKKKKNEGTNVRLLSHQTKSLIHTIPEEGVGVFV